MRVSRHNGRSGAHGAYNPKHNDREFELEKAEELKREYTRNNLYWNCIDRQIVGHEDLGENARSFTDVEKGYYNLVYMGYVNGQNERRHPKDGRYFPITDEIAEILDGIRAKQEELGIKSEYVFCREDGSWFDKDIYAQRLRRLCERMGYSITNNHAFRMSLNSNVFIPLGLPVTQRAYLLGHSVETNERFYSHMKTESLVNLKDVLNRASHTNDAQSESIHTHTHTKIVDFGQIKNSEASINTRHFGI